MYKPQVQGQFFDEPVNCTGNVCFEGFCIDLLAKLAERIEKLFRTPFKYELHLVQDGKFGSIGEDGEWNGMIGELLNNVKTSVFFSKKFLSNFSFFNQKLAKSLIMLLCLIKNIELWEFF